MENFQTEDVKLIMSKIMQTMMDPSQQVPFKADLSQVKPSQSAIGQDSPIKTRKIGAKAFQKNTYNRMLIRQQKRNDSVRKLKERLDKQQAERIKKKPQIDKKSKQMIGSSTPLHQRVPQMVQEKERRMKQLIQKRQEEQAKIQEPDLTFRPKILKPNKGEKRNFYDYTQQWRDKKLVFDQIRKLEVEEQQKKHLTFRPQVDARSEVMAQNVNHGKPVEVRLNQRLKLYQQSQEQKRVQMKHSFAPVISKKSEEIAKKKIESDVFNRLYSASKDVLVQEVSVEEEEEELKPERRSDLDLQFLMGRQQQK